MNLTEAQDELALRLYDWSRRDLVREMSEGCPLLSLVGLNNRYLTAFTSWVRSMPRTDQEALARALTRRAHERAAALRGERLNPDMQKQINERFFAEVAARESSLPPLATADSGQASFIPVDPAHCLRSVLQSISPVLGTPARRRTGVHTTRLLGEWKLVTMFEFRHRDRVLYYEYDFVRIDGEPKPPGYRTAFPRSLLMFYGVTNTMVQVPAQADSEPMAGVIVKLAEHFMRQADSLFAGLGINDLAPARPRTATWTGSTSVGSSGQPD